mmetsp:Transcript_7198/g.15712  ORF Transcript_7198/g.15712 Transcript_7198/m.15712 type:complete len:204 (+) Transcript_7198:797-1408(+)
MAGTALLIAWLSARTTPLLVCRLSSSSLCSCTSLAKKSSQLCSFSNFILDIHSVVLFVLASFASYSSLVKRRSIRRVRELIGIVVRRTPIPHITGGPRYLYSNAVYIEICSNPSHIVCSCIARLSIVAVSLCIRFSTPPDPCADAVFSLLFLDLFLFLFSSLSDLASSSSGSLLLPPLDNLKLLSNIIPARAPRTSQAYLRTP